MTVSSLIGNFIGRFRQFRDANGGNVLMTFALATLPMVAFVGAAVDYSRGNSAKAAMQSAIDATGLILSKEAQTLDQTALNRKSGEVFLALLNRPELTDLVITPVYTNPSPSMFKLVIGVTGKVPTSFTKVVGKDTMDLSVSTEIVWGVKRLELALALDVTGSMASNNKMTELKKAAKSLLTTLQKAAKKDGDIKVAIVPFNVDVNVGTSYATADWINWSVWEGAPPNSMPGSNVGPGSSCPWTNSSHGFRCQVNSNNGSNTTSNVPSSGNICPTAKNGVYFNGCYNSIATTTTTTNTVCSGFNFCSCSGHSNCSCTGSGNNKVCTQTVTTTGQPYKHEWIANARSTWNGCVTDRAQDYDTNNIAPSTSIPDTQFFASQYNTCPSAAMMPLSTNWTSLAAKIDELSPNGNTNVTIGLAWAFHLLTAAGPINTAQVPSPDLDKVIILLTDGQNTQNRWSTNQNDIDLRTKKACDTVKAANVKLYTVRVIDGNASLLSQCASTTSMYYNVQDASQLNGVFATIAQELANLRIAR